MAAALDILASGGDYRPAYETLLALYADSPLREDALRTPDERFAALPDLLAEFTP